MGDTSTISVLSFSLDDIDQRPAQELAKKAYQEGIAKIRNAFVSDTTTQIEKKIGEKTLKWPYGELFQDFYQHDDYVPFVPIDVQEQALKAYLNSLWYFSSKKEYITQLDAVLKITDQKEREKSLTALILEIFNTPELKKKYEKQIIVAWEDDLGVKGIKDKKFRNYIMALLCRNFKVDGQSLALPTNTINLIKSLIEANDIKIGNNSAPLKLKVIKSDSPQEVELTLINPILQVDEGKAHNVGFVISTIKLSETMPINPEVTFEVIGQKSIVDKVAKNVSSKEKSDKPKELFQILKGNPELFLDIIRSDKDGQFALAILNNKGLMLELGLTKQSILAIIDATKHQIEANEQDRQSIGFKNWLKILNRLQASPWFNVNYRKLFVSKGGGQNEMDNKFDELFYILANIYRRPTKNQSADTKKLLQSIQKIKDKDKRKQLFLELIKEDENSSHILALLNHKNFMLKLEFTAQEFLDNVIGKVAAKLQKIYEEKGTSSMFQNWYKIFYRLTSSPIIGIDYNKLFEKLSEANDVLKRNKEDIIKKIVLSFPYSGKFRLWARKIIDGILRSLPGERKAQPKPKKDYLKNMRFRELFSKKETEKKLEYHFCFHGSCLDIGTPYLVDAIANQIKTPFAFGGPKLTGEDSISIAQDACRRFIVELIMWFKAQPEQIRIEKIPEFHINAIGFSRGAVNVLRFSNFLYSWLTDTNPENKNNNILFLRELFPQMTNDEFDKLKKSLLEKIKIDAVLIDPVPGEKLFGILGAPGTADDAGKTISPLIASCTVIRARDENRLLFKPLDVKGLNNPENNPKRLPIRVELIPGEHVTGCGYNGVGRKGKKDGWTKFPISKDVKAIIESFQSKTCFDVLSELSKMWNRSDVQNEFSLDLCCSISAQVMNYIIIHRLPQYTNIIPTLTFGFRGNELRVALAAFPTDKDDYDKLILQDCWLTKLHMDNFKNLARRDDDYYGGRNIRDDIPPIYRVNEAFLNKLEAEAFQRQFSGLYKLLMNPQAITPVERDGLIKELDKMKDISKDISSDYVEKFVSEQVIPQIKKLKLNGDEEPRNKLINGILKKYPPSPKSSISSEPSLISIPGEVMKR